MKSSKEILSLIILIISMTSCEEGENLTPDKIKNIPYPSHTNYTGVYIKPDNYSQSELDNHTAHFIRLGKMNI